MFEIFERIMPDAEGRTEFHYVLIDYLCSVYRRRAYAASDVSRVNGWTNSISAVTASPRARWP